MSEYIYYDGTRRVDRWYKMGDKYHLLRASGRDWMYAPSWMNYVSYCGEERGSFNMLNCYSETPPPNPCEDCVALRIMEELAE